MLVVRAWKIIHVSSFSVFLVNYMHIHAPFIMYCSRLFVVVFNCLHTFKHAYVRWVTELHLSTKFHVCQCCGYSEIRELKKKKKKKIPFLGI